MSGKPNPHINTKSREKPKPHKKRITYSGKQDAKAAAYRRGGNSRPYQVKGGWRITKRTKR